MTPVVVISGASGMTGSETVRRLLGRGYDVVGFDNGFASSIESLSDVLGHERFTFLNYDLRDTSQMNRLERMVESRWPQGNALVSVINCAAVVHTKYFYRPESTFETNVIGMKTLLEMAIRLKARAFINCSSSEVYSLGSYKDGGVREEDPLLLATAETSLRTSYAVGKLMTEFFTKNAVDEGAIRGCSIRFANVYSNDEFLPEHVIPYTIDALLQGGTVRLCESAQRTTRSFVHNYDSCSAVIALLETDSALDGGVYNVATSEEVSIPDLVHQIAHGLGRRSAEIIYEGVRTADPERRLLSTEKIQARTTWRPRVSLDEGLKMCIDYRKRKAS